MSKNSNAFESVEFLLGGLLVLTFGIGYGAKCAADGIINMCRNNDKYNKAVSEMNKGNYSNAYELLKDLDQQDIAVCCNMAICLYRTNPSSRKIKYYCLKCLKQDKNFTYANFIYAAYLHDQGKGFKALIHIKRIKIEKLLDDEDRAYFLFLQGKIYLSLEDPNSLAEMISKLHSMKNEKATEYANELKEAD